MIAHLTYQNAHLMVLSVNCSKVHAINILILVKLHVKHLLQQLEKNVGNNLMKLVNVKSEHVPMLLFKHLKLLVDHISVLALLMEVHVSPNRLLVQGILIQML